MIKSKFISLLQRILGFENYLYYFSRLKIYMLKKDRYEVSFRQFMDLIKDGDSILDIGANIGITAIPMARAFPNMTLHAFEPIPENASALKRVIRHYKLKNIVLHEIALGEAPGELKLVLPVINGVKMQGLSHVYREGEDSEWNRGEIFSIPVKKLDDVEGLQQLKKLAAIKIDVENFEYYVLKGGREILTKHSPVIYCELWDNEMRQPVVDYLKELDYGVKIFEGDKLVDFNGQTENNFIFIKA